MSTESLQHRLLLFCSAAALGQTGWDQGLAGLLTIQNTHLQGFAD